MFSTHLDCSLLEVESLLHDGRQFPDASALLPQHVLCPGGEDDDFCAGRGNPDLAIDKYRDFAIYSVETLLPTSFVILFIAYWELIFLPKLADATVSVSAENASFFLFALISVADFPYYRSFSVSLL